MAKLPEGQKAERKKQLARLVHYLGLGLTEEEIAEETGLDRRTVNNYLRELDQEEQVHKEGRKWWPF
jgi:DNA-binding transcriptional regulator LsrR (DeoR family)